MSFGEQYSSLHASDLASGGRGSPHGGGAEEARETRRLREENKQLRLCLLLMRDQAELESANLISSVIAWCDDRFRKKFIDMSLSQSSRHHGVISPFRPISPPTSSIAIRTNAQQSTSAYETKGSTFSNRSLGSPLTASQLVSRPEGPEQSHLAASSVSQSQSPSMNRTKSPVHNFSPTQTDHRQTQSSGTGTLSQAGASGQGPHSFLSNVTRQTSPLDNVTGHTSPLGNFTGHTSPLGNVTGHTSPLGHVAGHRSPFDNVSGHISPLGNVTGHTSPLSDATRHTSPRPPSPRTANYGGASDITRGDVGFAYDRPASPKFNNVTGRHSRESSGISQGPSFGGGVDRPPTPRDSYYSGSDRPASPVSEQSASLRSPRNNMSNRPPSPRADDPGLPRSTFGGSDDRPVSPRQTSRPTSPHSTMYGSDSNNRPPSSRHTSRPTSPHSFMYGSGQNNQPTADQSSRYDTSSQPRRSPVEEVSRRLQFNPDHGTPIKLPREAEISAAYNSTHTGRGNFTATLETQDLSATMQTLNRPESTAFIPTINDSGFQGRKSYSTQGTPQTMAHSFVQPQYQHPLPSAPPQLRADDTSFIRPASPHGQRSFSQPQRQTPQQYQDVRSFTQTDQSVLQGYPTVQPPQPTSFAPQPTSFPPQPASFAPHPPYHEQSTSGKEQSGEERSLTPFPDMHTRTLPSNMISIREEMESEMRSRGPSPSPVDVNKFTEQLFGTPLAASTPKKTIPKFPHRVKSPVIRKRTRTPSPKGTRSPSPYSDDSIKAQSRRSAANVKPSHRILGEVAFQLERRILDYVFARHRNAENRDRSRRRFYGYTVSNIGIMINKESLRHDGTIDDHTEFQLKYRLKYIVTSLGPFGYQIDRHGIFAQEMINKYGLLSNAPDRKTLEAFGLADADALREFVARLASSETEKRDVLILLECLFVLAHDDGRPIFLW